MYIVAISSTILLGMQKVTAQKLESSGAKINEWTHDSTHEANKNQERNGERERKTTIIRILQNLMPANVLA